MTDTQEDVNIINTLITQDTPQPPAKKKPDTVTNRKRFKPASKSFNDKKKKKFLELLRETGHLCNSAKMVGVCPTTIFLHKKKDPDFAKAVEEAQELLNAKIEDALVERGIVGVDKGIYYKGVKVATEKEYSDTLLMFHARANMEKYRNSSSLEISGKGGGPIELSVAKAKLLELCGVTLDGEFEEVER